MSSWRLTNVGFGLLVAVCVSWIPRVGTAQDIPQEIRADSAFFMIPEFHDSQRFRNAAGVYGPYVRAFGLPDGEKWDLKYFSQMRRVGFVLVDTWTLNVTWHYGVSGLAGVAMPSAPLGIPDWPSLKELGLHAGWNCVFLVHQGSDPNAGWQAQITPLKPNGSGAMACPTDVRPSATLVVKPQVDATEAAVYPGVGRIVEATDNRYGFGFRCAQAWCTILPPGATVPTPVHDGLIAHTMQSDVPGWFDEQTLAVAAPPLKTIHNGRVVVDPASVVLPAFNPAMRASIIPDSRLQSVNLAAFVRGWVHVATVVIDPNARNFPPKYSNKWGFRPGLNEIEMMMSEDGVHGRARVINSKREPTFLNVRRTDHHHDLQNMKGVTMRATARWAWVDKDDAIWVFCDVGCCYMDPGSIS